MKVIILKEKERHDWWFADGTQPIGNGDSCVVIDEEEDKKPIFYIASCRNCGDYTIEDIDDIVNIKEEDQ